MTELAEMHCSAPDKSDPPLQGDKLNELRAEVPEWDVLEGKRLFREFDFPDFAAALAFVDRVGALAEQQNHHPDIKLSYGKAEVELSTHKIGGLSLNDFILAAKIDRLTRES